MSKYNNKRAVVDGITFASIAEAKRYQELKILKQTHKIKDFEMQPRYLLQPAFRKCTECNHIQPHIPNSKKKHDTHCHECGAKSHVWESMEYVGDFLVYHLDGSTTLEDVKGSKKVLDPVFRVKQKLFELRYPDKTIEIVIRNGRST